MNENKFLFVTCVNDEELYATYVRHIQKLYVPQNFTVQLFPIRGARSMAEGYNMALTNEAKYKIYLHQDTFILNTNFLYDILELLQANSVLDLLGMIGCKALPPNGVWWEESGLIGKVIGVQNNTYRLVRFVDGDPV